MYLPLNNFVNGKIISNGGPNNKLFSPKYLFLIFLTFIFCLYFLIQKWPNNSFINYQHFDNKKLINSNSNERKQSLEECIENDKNRSDTKWNSECCGEKMSYSFIIKTNDKLTENMVSGRRFDCKHLPLLHKYKLADNYKIQQKIPVKKPGSNGFTIVTASDLRYFPRLHKLLYVLKKQFGCSQKIIVYDLGGMSEDKNTMELLNAVCALELRKFNWSIMPEDLRHLLVYAWKIYIIAEIYAKYDTFIWMDSAVVFNDTNPLNTIFEAMENEKISEAVMPRQASHGIQYATDLRMYTFIPMVTKLIKIENKWDKIMYEANFIIMHKSEHTRQLLKWALLCAATKQCINPDGTKLACSGNMVTDIAKCHRFDQSAFGILTVNSEYQRSVLNNDKKFLPHFHDEHPRRKFKHELQRRNNFDKTFDFKKEVECCKN